MKRTFNLRALLAAMAFGLMAGHAFAEETAASTAQAVTQAVQLQLAAFADDDAEKAFSLATAATQSLAGTPNAFLRLIKQRFTPIYRHRHALYSEPEIMGAWPAGCAIDRSREFRMDRNLPGRTRSGRDMESRRLPTF